MLLIVIYQIKESAINRYCSLYCTEQEPENSGTSGLVSGLVQLDVLFYNIMIESNYK